MGGELTAARRVLAELPDVFRPAWAAEAWNGTFGARHLRAVVDSAETTLVLGAGPLTGTSRVAGHIEGATGSLLARAAARLRGGDAHVGAFRHAVTLDDSGRLLANHDLLRLAPGSRRTGFGTDFVERGRAVYGAAGVDEATMTAGLGVGGYAWARQGLQLPAAALDDAARIAERGRAVAEVVDAARAPISRSGRSFRVGARITEAEHAALAPRLVRGDHVPADAITSMEQLAAVPELGRKVLLGRTWTGVAELERTAPWWLRNGSRSMEQLGAGVSWRTAPNLVAGQSRAAAERIAAALPAAADPYRAGAAFDAAAGARAVVRVGLDDVAPTAATTLRAPLPGGGHAAIDVAWDGAELVATERLPLREMGSDRARATLDAAWRELGVDRVRSGWTGRYRSVAGS